MEAVLSMSMKLLLLFLLNKIFQRKQSSQFWILEMQNNSLTNGTHDWLRFCGFSNSTPHSWRHKRACKVLLDWYSDKQHALSLKNTLLESSLQKARSPIFPCPCLRASSSQVQLHLDNRFLGNSNSPLIRTESESPGLTSCIYCKFNLKNPKPRSQQCFVAPFLCISPMIPFTASDFMLCLSEIQSLNALHTSIFRQVCGALLCKIEIHLPCTE